MFLALLINASEKIDNFKGSLPFPCKSKINANNFSVGRGDPAAMRHFAFVRQLITAEEFSSLNFKKHSKYAANIYILFTLFFIKSKFERFGNKIFYVHTFVHDWKAYADVTDQKDTGHGRS